jgi:hypothetical protein
MAESETELAKSWNMKIEAQRLDNGIVDKENIIGAAAGATDSIDNLDIFEPPIIGEKSLSVSFASSEGPLTHDLRSTTSEGWVWDLKVITPDEYAKAKLDIDGIDTSRGLHYLLDLDTKMVHRMKEQKQTLTINTIKGTRNFRLIIGSKSFVEKNSLGLKLFPTEYTLYQNYPNPFNPSTVIRFSLPMKSCVKLTIYDILGREIERLLDGQFDESYQEIEWKTSVSTGVYLYRIEAVSVDDPNKRFVDVKKMVLLR